MGAAVIQSEQPQQPHPMELKQIFRHTAARFGISLESMIARLAERGVICVPRNVAIMTATLAGYPLPQVATFSNRTIQAARQVVKRVASRPQQLRLVRSIWDEIGGSSETLLEYLGYVPEPAKRSEFALSGWSHYGDSGEVIPERPSEPNLFRNMMDMLGLGDTVFAEKALHQAMLKQAIVDFVIGADASRWIYQGHVPPGGPGIAFDDACASLNLNPNVLRKQILQLPTLDEVSQSETGDPDDQS